jgi:hypothetical protein
MRSVYAVAFALFATLLAATSSSAHTLSGSHAWSKSTLELRTGPGTKYAITGAIAGITPVKVLRCQKQWCVVDGPTGRGWTNISDIDFGRTTQNVAFNIPAKDMSNGEMCFYEGANYTGAYFCLSSGNTVRDLALAGWDNRVNSVLITVPTSAALCRDRTFQSYCEVITESQPRLNRYLARNLSSLRVY